MLLKRAVDREWISTGNPGVDRALFRNNDQGGRSSVVRLARGSRVPRHAHHGTEEVLVLEGTVTLDGVEMGPGDYLYTTPGEEHDVVAVTNAIIFVSSEKAVTVVETALAPEQRR